MRISKTLTTAVVLGLLTGGCNLIGALAYKFSGPPEVAAKFELPKRRTLVLVENFRNPSLVVAETDILSQYIEQGIEDKKLAPLVPFDNLVALRGKEGSNFRKMTIPQIGKTLGAEQVIYVDYLGGGVQSTGGQAMQGKAGAQVKVVECSTGQTLWPQEMSAGEQVGFSTELKRTDKEIRETDLQSEVYEGLSTNIVRLFHKWKSDQ